MNHPLIAESVTYYFAFPLSSACANKDGEAITNPLSHPLCL